MSDRRRDWRLFLRMRADKVTHGNGWMYVSEGSLAHCRRERDAHKIGPDEHWVDSTIRRPENDPRKEDA